MSYSQYFPHNLMDMVPSQGLYLGFTRRGIHMSTAMGSSEKIDKFDSN